MPLHNIRLTREDFDQYDWKEVIAESQRQLCRDYAHAFRQRAEAANENGDVKEHAVFSLLYAVTSFRIDPDASQESFQPLFTTGAARSPIPDDLDNEDLSALASLLPVIDDPELHARIADILWTRKKADYRVAVAAIESYLQTATNLEGTSNNKPTLLRYERALDLAAQLGRNQPHLGKVAARILEVLHRLNGEDDTFFSSSLSGLLYAYKQGNPDELASLSEKAARYNESRNEYRIASSYWDAASRWHQRAGDEESTRKTRINAAECWVKLAEGAPTHSVAATHYTRAFEAYRQISGTEDRREEIHHLILTAQKRSVQELGQISTDISNKKVQDDAQAEVQGKPFEDAIEALAFITVSPRRDELEQRVRTSAQQAPFMAFVAADAINAMGKVIGRKPHAFDDEQGAFEHMLLENANFDRHWSVVNLIEPARRRILADHHVRTSDFIHILEKNPFVPPDRGWTYARGLHAGLTGDFSIAVHFLIPQLEESLRYLLRQKGVITSGLDDYRIQHERDLNRMLKEPDYRSHVVEMLGEDLTFDLEGLLVRAAGANLRNDIAHGFLSDGAYQAPPVIYLWWITLRLCCLYLHVSMPNETTGNDNGEDASN